MEKTPNHEEIERILGTDFAAQIMTPFVMEVDENAICVPGIYRNSIGSVKNFFVRDEDVFVMGYPKTGTTWSQEMVWLLVNNLDYEGAKENILKRFPLLEYPSSLTDHTEGSDWIGDAINIIGKMENPRLIKSHLPWFLLPDQIQNGSKLPKILYVLRNPKDCCVSYYHYLKFLRIYNGPFENFYKLALAGREPYGSFWKTVLSFWQERHRSNILLVEYKEMKESLPVVIKRVANFLGKPITEKQVERLADHLSFDSMKKNPAINHQTLREKFDEHTRPDENSSFFRRGKVGDYMSLMTPEIVEQFDAWSKKNLATTNFNIESLSG